MKRHYFTDLIISIQFATKLMPYNQSARMVELLERRFGLLPEWDSEKLESAKTKELEAWSDAIFTAPTHLEAVFKKSDVSKKS
jgi:hypothetical protein